MTVNLPTKPTLVGTGSVGGTVKGDAVLLTMPGQSVAVISIS